MQIQSIEYLKGNYCKIVDLADKIGMRALACLSARQPASHSLYIESALFWVRQRKGSDDAYQRIFMTVDLIQANAKQIKRKSVFLIKEKEYMLPCKFVDQPLGFPAPALQKFLQLVLKRIQEIKVFKSSHFNVNQLEAVTSLISKGQPCKQKGFCTSR